MNSCGVVWRACGKLRCDEIACWCLRERLRGLSENCALGAAQVIVEEHGVGLPSGPGSRDNEWSVLDYYELDMSGASTVKADARTWTSRS